MQTRLRGCRDEGVKGYMGRPHLLPRPERARVPHAKKTHATRHCVRAPCPLHAQHMHTQRPRTCTRQRRPHNPRRAGGRQALAHGTSTTLTHAQAHAHTQRADSPPPTMCRCSFLGSLCCRARENTTLRDVASPKECSRLRYATLEPHQSIHHQCSSITHPAKQDHHSHSRKNDTRERHTFCTRTLTRAKAHSLAPT